MSLADPREMMDGRMVYTMPKPMASFDPQTCVLSIDSWPLQEVSERAGERERERGRERERDGVCARENESLQAVSTCSRAPLSSRACLRRDASVPMPAADLPCASPFSFQRAVSSEPHAVARRGWHAGPRVSGLAPFQ